MRKKIIVKLLVLSLLVGGLSQWSGGSKAKAASSYWLYGTGLTKSQGGEAGCRIKMYYRGGKLIIKGGMSKVKKKFDWDTSKKIKAKTRKYKVASNCKVVECEGNEEYSYAIKKFTKQRGIKSTTSHGYRRRFGGASEDTDFNGLRCRYQDYFGRSTG